MFYSKNLKKFKNIKHGFFSKKGGFSKGIYKSLNCGRGSKDDKRNIKRNLALVSKRILLNQKNLKLMYQTHGNKVILINKKNKNNKIFFCDALITNLNEIGLGVVTADCVPILIYDSLNNVIGCVHAGWKGAISGIIENTIIKIKNLNKKCKIFAAVGPCIGKKSYEVNLTFYKNFISKSKKNSIYFKTKNKYKKFFNLRKFVSNKLLRLNISVDHVNRDTFAEKSSFFSYRRSQKLGESDYGRCISVVSLTKFSQN